MFTTPRTNTFHTSASTPDPQLRARVIYIMFGFAMVGPTSCRASSRADTPSGPDSCGYEPRHAEPGASPWGGALCNKERRHLGVLRPPHLATTMGPSRGPQRTQTWQHHLRHLREATADVMKEFETVLGTLTTSSRASVPDWICIVFLLV